MRLKVADGLRLFIFSEDEVFALEAVDGFAVSIFDDDIDDDKLGAGGEDRAAGSGASRQLRVRG